jgi:hypothetical protein
MWPRVALVLCCAGCATIEPERPRSVARPDPAPAAAVAPTDDELPSAWAAETAPAARGPVERPEAPAPRTDRRAAFLAARDLARTALRAHQLDEARTAAAQAVEAARPLHGRERQEAGQLAFAIEKEAGDLAAAQAAALAWRGSCGPEDLEGCRARALSALEQARGPGASALATRLREAEACLGTRDPRPCLGKVERTAAMAQDEVLLARAGLVRALAEKDDGRRLGALDRVQERCTAPGCVAARHRALGVMASMAQAKGDYAAAARALIRDGLVTASTVEPELRPWVRASELDGVCVKLDAAEGAGTCRRLEKLVAGGWSFRDFSRRKGGSGLTLVEVKLVNQHYAPLLEACLGEEARRLVPPDAREYEVFWVVHNDGRVYDAHLRTDLDATPLAECLKRQFATWRYPRFEGEFQNVQQRFTVTASTRSAGWE